MGGILFDMYTSVTPDLTLRDFLEATYGEAARTMNLQFVPFCDMPLDRIGGSAGWEPSSRYYDTVGCSRIFRHTTDGWGQGQLLYASIKPEAMLHVSLPLTRNTVGFGMGCWWWWRIQCTPLSSSQMHTDLVIPPDQTGFVPFVASVAAVDFSPGSLGALLTVNLTNNLGKPLDLTISSVQCRHVMVCCLLLTMCQQVSTIASLTRYPLHGGNSTLPAPERARLVARPTSVTLQPFATQQYAWAILLDTNVGGAGECVVTFAATQQGVAAPEIQNRNAMVISFVPPNNTSVGCVPIMFLVGMLIDTGLLSHEYFSCTAVSWSTPLWPHAAVLWPRLDMLQLHMCMFAVAAAAQHSSTPPYIPTNLTVCTRHNRLRGAALCLLQR